MAMKADDVYAILSQRVKNGGATDEQIQNAVNQFLIENPVQVGIKVSDIEPTEESVEVWINPNEEEEYQFPEIRDDEESEVDTWSSKKINEKYGELNSELGYFKSIEYSETNGYINYINGNLTSSSSIKSSDYIPVNVGDIVKLTGVNINKSDYRGCAVYKNDKSFLQGFQYTTNEIIEIEIAETGFIRATLTPNFKIYMSINGLHKSISDVISNQSNLETIQMDNSRSIADFKRGDNIVFNSLKLKFSELDITSLNPSTLNFVENDNVITVNGNATNNNYSLRIKDLKKFKRINFKFNAKIISGVYPALSIYKNNSYLISKTLTDYDQTFEIEIDINEDDYLQLVFTKKGNFIAEISDFFIEEVSYKLLDEMSLKEALNTIILNYPIGNNPLDVLLEDAGFVTCFEKIACIGDSLTAGNSNYNSPSTGEYRNDFCSYPDTMRRITGSTIYKLASGGLTASNSTQAESDNHSWLKAAELEKNNWLSEDKKSNAYIIALGTNDIGYYGIFDGDPKTDIDTNDFSNNAKNSVGGYATIIQKIKEIQPKAKIFCVTIPKTRNSEATRVIANEKIKEIAKIFECYVIDLYTYGVQDNEVSEWKSIYYNGGHLNALGYNQLAKMIITYIDWIIRNNFESFKTIQFIGTDYEYN